MVDAVVSFVVERLGDFLIQEAVFLRGVKNEVKWLKNELGWLQCYITNAEEKQSDDPMIRKWLSDITEIAYDIEDVLDEFIVQVHDDEASTDLQYQVEDGGTDQHPETKTGCFGSTSSCIFDKKYCSSPYKKTKKKVNLYNIGKKIEELKIRINDLSRKRELYGLQDSTNKMEGNSSTTLGRLKQLRRVTSFSVEEKVVGFEDDAAKLLEKLFDKETHRFVISIYGMGGLGKTTLARKLYDNHDVKTKFHCCGWVSVSQDYNTRDLLIRIVKSFGITTVKMEELKQMSEDDLERHLHQYLRGRLYLVVIDDVWQKEAWESLRRAFPDNENGSRVIITTRIKEVAERSDERTHAHRLRFLRLDESWQLFCEKTFRNSDGSGVDEEFKTLGMEMVQKCNGLPLAIVVLGGLLFTKTRLKEWKVVRQHFWQCLRNDSIHITYLLALSFNDLSHQLKLCFLYLSIFPEDFEINVEELIRLWTAEGFVSHDEIRTTEDVAEDNFNALINRSLLHVEKRSWGRVSTCRVHDLLRDLSIQKAKELRFLHIYDQIKHSTHDSSVMSSCRREAVYSETERCLWLQQSNPSLRSLFFFNPYRRSWDIMEQLTHMCIKFRFLRVLNLNGYRASENSWTLSEEIGKLIHLKYLYLRESYISKLPPSILNLRGLETLDVLSEEVEVELPRGFFKLQELKHLFGFFSGPIQISGLRKLHSLRYVSNESWIKINTEKLVNLRELWIYGQLSKELKAFRFDSIAKLKRLGQLSVKLQFGDSFASLGPLYHCSNLVNLRLNGKIGKLPANIDAVLPNLECLLLENSRLKDDPMSLLETLPRLMILYLRNNFFTGKKLTCRFQGFPRLEILKLGKDDKLEEWHIEEGAMPILKKLSYPKDSKLTFSGPWSWKSLAALGEYELEEDWYDLLL
ncbi:hypothetical protein ACOSQ3_008840 [Xanthoceras sorbifolium]